VKQQISPWVAVVVCVVAVIVIGGLFLIKGSRSQARPAGNGPAGLNVQSSNQPMPAQTVIPKAEGR